MATRRAIGTTPIIIGMVAIILVAAAGFLITTGQSSHSSSPNQTTASTIVVTSSASPSFTATSSLATTATCYGGKLPTNSSSSGTQTNRIVFNVTAAFDSWDWTSLSTFRVGSYTFVTKNPAAAPSTAGTTTFYLEPQLFFNVTNTQGQTQETSFTNFGGFNGQVWPPDMGLQATLFGGNVTIQWLFLCDNHSVFLEVTTTPSQGTNMTTGPSVVSLPQPPFVSCSLVPGISEVIVNGTTKCVVGPPIVVNDDGVVDFRNGTGVDLYANLTGSSFIAGTSYDTVVTLQATRFIFNAHGLIATFYPYQGRELFANGTVTTFPACAYSISTSTQYPRGTSGNGTVYFPAAGGGTVWFYPDGTCSETNG